MTAPPLLPLQLHLNSEYAFQQGDDYHNDCTFDVHMSAPLDHGMYISLVSFTVPHTWLVINTYTNTLTVDGTDYMLPPGNYTAAKLTAALAAALPCSVTFDSTTLKMQLSSSTSMQVSGSMCTVLGLPASSTGTVLQSTYTVDLSGCQSIYMLTDTCTTGNQDTRPGSNLNVIARIPVSVQPGSIVDYQPSTPPGFWVQSGELASLHLLLEDDRRRPLQSSLFWEATLRIDFLPNGQQRLQRQNPTELSMSYE